MTNGLHDQDQLPQLFARLRFSLCSCGNPMLKSLQFSDFLKVSPSIIGV